MSKFINMKRLLSLVLAVMLVLSLVEPGVVYAAEGGTTQGLSENELIPQSDENSNNEKVDLQSVAYGVSNIFTSTYEFNSDDQYVMGFSCAATGSNAQLVLKPSAASNIQLIRGDATYDVAWTDGEMLVIWEDGQSGCIKISQYYANEANSGLSDVTPTEGDVFVVSGGFTDGTNTVTVDTTYITVGANSTITAGTTKPAKTMKQLTNHATGVERDENGNSDKVWFMATHSAGNYTVLRPTENTNIQLRRGGETYNIGMTDRDMLVTNTNGAAYLEFQQWWLNTCNAGVSLPLAENDVLVIGGRFQTSDAAVQVDVETTYIAIGADKVLTFSTTEPSAGGSQTPEEPTPPVETTYTDVSAMQKDTAHTGMETNSINTESFFYFVADANDLAPDSSWSTRFRPESADAIKLTRNGVTTSIGNTGEGALIKLDATSYVLVMAKWAHGDDYPFKEGDILTIEGKFVGYRTEKDEDTGTDVSIKTGTGIKIAQSVITIGEGGLLSFSTDPEPVQTEFDLGTLAKHSGGDVYNGLYFTVSGTEYPAVDADWGDNVRYAPKDASNIQRRNAEDPEWSVVGKVDAKTVVHYTEGNNWFLEGWAIDGVLNPGDQLLIGGEFVNGDITLTIQRTLINVKWNGTIEFITGDAIETTNVEAKPNWSEGTSGKDIGIWNGGYSAKAMYQLRAAGINMIMNLQPYWLDENPDIMNAKMTRILDLAKIYGITVYPSLVQIKKIGDENKEFVWDGTYYWRTETAPAWLTHDAIGGWMAWDEPSRAETNGHYAEPATLAASYAKFKELQQAGIFGANQSYFVNLLGDDAADSDTNVEGGDYSGYLTDYGASTDEIGSDIYPFASYIYKNKGTDVLGATIGEWSIEIENGVRKNYFADMLKLANKAEADDKDFTYTLLSSGHTIELSSSKDSTKIEYKLQTAEQMRWQGMVGLCFGADNFVYYSYGTKDEDYSSPWDVDTDEPTNENVITNFSTANTAIRNMQTQLGTWQGVSYVSGGNNAMLDKMTAYDTSIQANTLFTSTQPLLVGRYSNGYMLTNAGTCELYSNGRYDDKSVDYFADNFAMSDATVTLSADSVCSVLVNGTKLTAENGTYSFTVGAYDAVFVTVNESHSWSNEWTNDDSQHWHACTNCGAVGEKTAHTLTTVSDGENGHHKECDCGYKTATTAHTYVNNALGTKVNDATCTEAEKHYAKCDDCEYEDRSKTVDSGSPAGHNMTTIAEKTADCENPGNNKYFYCDSCEKYFKDEQGNQETTVAAETIPAKGHSWKASWTWTVAQDNSSATATLTLTCENDSTHVQTPTVTVTSSETKPSCTAKGEMTFEASATYDNVEYKDTNKVELSVQGHDYGQVTYKWSDDFTNCTASHTCQRTGCGYVETATPNAINELETTPATCTKAGSVTMKAVFVEAWAGTATKTVETSALGHTYGEPVWSWEGFSSATATFTCTKNCNEEGATKTVTATDEAIKCKIDAVMDCENDGKETYTATVNFNDKTYTNEKVNTITKRGHSFEGMEVTYDASALTSVTATQVCKYEGCTYSRTATSTAVQDKTVSATCTTGGYTEHTATFDNSVYDWVAASYTWKTNETTATGHSYKVANWNWPTNGEAPENSITVSIGCDKCDFTDSADATVTKDASKSTAPNCTATGQDVYTASVEYSGKTFKTSDSENYTATIAAKGHSYSVTFDWTVDETTHEAKCVAKGICGTCSDEQTATVDKLTDSNPTDMGCGVKKYSYTAVFTADFIKEVDRTQTYSYTDNSNPSHAWNDVTYTWNEDYSSCTAKRVCKDNAEHYEIATGKIESKTTADATCTKPGEVKYTATFDESWAQTQSKDVPTTTVDHTFTTKDSGKVASAADCVSPAKHYVQCDNCDAVSATITVSVGKALGHNEVIDARVEPTCTKTGLTEGKHCSRCNTVLIKQVEIPVVDHKLETRNAKDATCTEAGYTGDEYCTECKQPQKNGTTIAALGHSYKDGKCVRCDAVEPSGSVIENNVDTSGNGYKVVKIEKIPSDVLSSLGYADEAQLVSKMTVDVKEDMAGATVNVYDVQLQYTTDNGTTWTQATAETFPAGGVTVCLPYPAGTSASSHNFTVTHMRADGTIENMSYEATENGLKVTFMSLSPVAVGYTAKTVSTEPTSPGTGTTTTGTPATGDSSHIVLWIIVMILAVLLVVLIQVKLKYFNKK